MQRSSSSITDSKGNKVIVVRSDDFYNTLSPIKILRPNEKVGTVRKVPALCNRIVIGSKGKDKVRTNMVGCDTCRNNMPSSSSHACGNFPEGSKKPLNKQVNILRKSRTPKSPSKKKRDNFSIDEVGRDVTKRTMDFRKIHKKAVVRRSKGPKSTSNLVKDATPKQLNIAVIDLTNLSHIVSDTSPAQESSDDFDKPGPLYKISKEVLNSRYIGIPKSSSDDSNTFSIYTPPRQTFAIIDLTTSPDPTSPEPPQTPPKIMDVKLNDGLDESAVLDLLDQQYGNVPETELLIKKEQIDMYSTESDSLSNSTYSLSIAEPAGENEILMDISQSQIKEEKETLNNELDIMEYSKIKNDEAYNKYFNNWIPNSPDSACDLFTPDQLAQVPDKIFESPVKTKRPSMNSHDESVSNIPKELLESFSKVNSAVTLDELHNSVEIKKEIISDSDLVDDDILEDFQVLPDNTSEKQSYAADPTICETFEDVKSPTNNVIPETKHEDTLHITTGNSQKTNESATSSSHYVDLTENNKDLAAPFLRTSPLKIWDIPPENINLDVELAESSRDARSPLSELLDIVFNTVSEPVMKASEAVKHPDLVETAFISSLARELAKSTSNIPKETAIFVEARTNDYLDMVLSDVSVTKYVNEDVETLICTKTDEIDNLETTDSKSPDIDNTSNPKMENGQIVEAVTRESPKYDLEDIFTNTDEDLSTSEIAIRSEIGESTKSEDDILEVDIDTKESVSETTESVGRDKDTSEEAPDKQVPERNLDEDVLNVIHCDHSYGLILNQHMSLPALPKSPLAEKIATETVPIVDDTMKVTEKICAETEDVVFIEIDTLEPIIEEADKNVEENVSQHTSEDAVTERNKTNETEREPELEDLISFEQEQTNVNKQAIPQENAVRTACSHQATPLMSDTEISNLKNRIMDGTIKKEEILDIIEGQNLQYNAVNRNLEQRKCDIKHLGDCLKKQIDVMRKTYEYFDDIIEAGVKDLNGNVTESTVRNVMHNLHFVKEMVDKTFAYYDVNKYREKKVGYRVIKISKKDASQTWKDVPVARRAPFQTNSNVVRKRVTKSSSKLLTRTLYRMNKLLDALEKHKGVLRSQKSNAFVSKLKEMARKDLSSVVATKSMEGEGLGAETGRDEVVTNDPPGIFKEVVLDSTQTSEMSVKPVESRKVLNNIENISSADWNTGFKGFATKITPTSRNIKIILSQTENVNERDTREKISRDILEKKTKKISKAKAGRASQDLFLLNTTEDRSTDTAATKIDKKESATLPVNKVPEKKETTVENYIKQSWNISTPKQEEKFPTRIMNSESRSRRFSRKPPGFYSESKTFVQDSSKNNTSLLKYQIDCSKLDDFQSDMTEYADLTYELKNDDKPCVILYNKTGDIKTPIFRTGEPLATVLPPKVEKTDQPKIPDEIKTTDYQPIQLKEPKRVLRNKKKPKLIMPKRSLRSTTMKERNAIEESLKASQER